MQDIGIYVHIPFCKQKCKYCDFISFCEDDEKQEKYVRSLLKEIEYKKQSLKKIDTIYIGGGTPSFIDSEYIVQILNKIRENYEVKEDAEITIEVNPGTVTKEKLLDYKKAGINRISMGLQSTQDRLLKLIGRIHTYEEFLNSYHLIKEVGFININIDLMLALPTQTIDDLTDSLIKVIGLDPKHISIYSLILEEGTPLEKMVQNEEVQLVEEDIERKMYWKTKKMLEKNGYEHYEISNFAKKGFESKHNLNCWNQKEYLGLGLGAHSYYGGKRFSNTTDFNKYISNIENRQANKNVQIQEIQNKEEMAKEYMMLGFRKIEGISISEFEQKFRINPLFYFRFEIEKLVEQELIEVDLDRIKLTKKGLDFANIVFEEFV